VTSVLLNGWKIQYLSVNRLAEKSVYLLLYLKVSAGKLFLSGGTVNCHIEKC
jgi:hypothetical protein